MKTLFDTIRGICHFLMDRTPGGLPTVPPRPRQDNVWRQDGVALVSKVRAGADLEASVARSLELLGGLDRLASTGDTVMVKPNFNSPDPFPGSTDLDFLKAVLKLLLEAGARVVVGESSGGMWRPTRVTLAKLGVPELLAGMGVELVMFDARPKDWVRVEIEGDYLTKVTVARSAYDAAKIVYLPCMKTHKLASFSLSLKLAVGLMHPGERRGLHRRELERKAAEINLFRQPDLIIMDGRKAFVSGGPDKGELVEPGIIMASGDMVATDVEALKVLLSYNAKNRIPADPWDSPQIATALRHGLGARDGDYRVVEG
jgi:uncharacterized protein (DUF362 family)